jgi:hypothetical protein
MSDAADRTSGAKHHCGAERVRLAASDHAAIKPLTPKGAVAGPGPLMGAYRL